MYPLLSRLLNDAVVSFSDRRVYSVFLGGLSLLSGLLFILFSFRSPIWLDSFTIFDNYYSKVFSLTTCKLLIFPFLTLAHLWWLS